MREGVRERVRLSERGIERESVCLCVCVCERERERERECERDGGRVRVRGHPILGIITITMR